MYDVEQIKNKKNKTIDCTCDKCGVAFKKERRKIMVSLSHGYKGQYCSLTCSWAPKRKESACIVCGSKFSGRKKTCSKACLIESKRGIKKEYVRLTCCQCFAEYSVPPNEAARKPKVSFCSNKCKSSFKKRPFEDKIRIAKENGVENPELRYKEHVETNCGTCEKRMVVLASQVAKATKLGKVFCSNSCRSKYVHKHCNPTRYCTRSKPQAILLGIIKSEFSDLEVHNNHREFLDCGYELDIWMPTIKFAIEINGPTHYMPIYGEKNLDAIQQRDSIKYAEAHAKGVSVLVIDVSKLQTKMNEKFMREKFDSVIRPIIVSKLSPQIT